MKLALAIASLLAVLAAITIVLREHQHWTAWLISGALAWLWWRGLDTGGTNENT